ncbi:MAG TPA: MFS transporter [Acidimicrobiales bacterium]|nr:MFS transporter [Acidimicrobiales bacterium]
MTDQLLSGAAPEPVRIPRSPRGYFGWLAGQVGPAGLTPVVILLAVACLERFSNLAVSVLLPNIRDTFHINNQTAITIASLTSILPALLSPFAGFLSDRVDRVRFAQVGTVLVGVAAVGLGASPVLGVLIVFLLAQGLGLLVNTPTHNSLITDYYPPESLGTVFTFYLFAFSAIGLVAGPVAGGIGQLAGWRTSFIALAVPAAIGVVLLARMRDPGRGASIGLHMVDEERSSFWEGFRRVRSVRSLRRTWWAAAFFGGGVIAFLQLQSIFFKDVYHYNSAARGALTVVYGLGGLVGTIIGGRAVQVRLRRSRPDLLPVINGLMVVEFGVGIVLMGLLPWSWGSVAMLFFLSIGAAGFNPAYNAMIGLVTTPRLRGQAYSYSLIWVTLGAIVVAPIIGGIANHHERAATYVLGILVVGAGLVELTARQFVERDVKEAQTSQSAADVDALLAVRGLEVAYGGNLQILFGVDLDVQEGEVVALLGTNGAGKSTFLKAVSGLMDPIGGAVFFQGRDITHADAVTKAMLGMALVPGDRGVFPGLSVADNLRIAGWMFRSDQQKMKEATERVLSYFPVLRERLDVAAGDLSGGQQQMLVLAQALMGKPKLMMIDELSLGLAPVVVEQILETVRRLAEDGTTILLVEQSVNVALTVAKRAVFMEKGEIRFSGRTQELLERPDVLRAVFLEGAASAVDSAGPVEARTVASRSRKQQQAPTVLEVRGVSKRFGGVVANYDVSLSLREGEILGLLGPNGAGKTTLFDLISGFFPVDSGSIILHGLDITDLPPDARSRLGLGRSFQDSKLFPALTVYDTVKLALERHLEVRDPLAAALNLPAALDSEAEAEARALELIEMLGLGAFRNKFIAEISTGTRRLVDLACILAHEPSVILFDEPSSGIAQRESEALGPLLRKVRDLTGSSLLVIEHDMPLLTNLADEVVALDLGQVVVRGLPQEVVNDPRVVAAYLGTDAQAVARSGALAVTTGDAPTTQKQTPKQRKTRTRPLVAKRNSPKKEDG